MDYALAIYAVEGVDVTAANWSNLSDIVEDLLWENGIRTRCARMGEGDAFLLFPDTTNDSRADIFAIVDEIADADAILAA